MKGFTLLEVMIALAILAGVVLTVISSVNHHLTVVARDQEETVAVLLGRSKLDQPGGAAGEGTFAPAWPGYSWRTEVMPTDFPGISRQVLTVAWQGGGKKLALVKYVAN